VNLFIVVNSLAGGGAERVALTLCNEFSRRGSSVTLISLSQITHYALDELAPDVKILFLSQKSLMRGGIALGKIIGTQQPTHVLSMMREPSIFLSVFRIRKRERWIFREASPLNALLRKPRWKQLIYRGLLKLAYVRADVVIANSEGTASSINQLYELGGKLRVVYNPIPAPAPSVVDDKRAFENPHQDYKLGKTFISVGRLDRVKGFDILIEAFAKLVANVPACKLFIVGQGPLEDELREQISRLNITQNVTLTGWVADLASYYSKSDVYVSASRYEGFGNAIVEAMGFGCFPLISSCPGGSTEIIAAESHGRIFEAESVESLAHCLGAVCEMSHDRLNVMNRAKDFDVQTIGDIYASILSN
jgi:glycosyltransferase involved in cell wall biosynthesis